MPRRPQMTSPWVLAARVGLDDVVLSVARCVHSADKTRALPTVVGLRHPRRRVRAISSMARFNAAPAGKIWASRYSQPRSPSSALVAPVGEAGLYHYSFEWGVRGLSVGGEGVPVDAIAKARTEPDRAMREP